MAKYCIYCKQPITHHPNIVMNEPNFSPLTMEDITTKGMIYSDEGYMEYKISRLCEVCFDEITIVDEDELQAYRNKLITKS